MSLNPTLITALTSILELVVREVVLPEIIEELGETGARARAVQSRADSARLQASIRRGLEARPEVLETELLRRGIGLEDEEEGEE